MLIYRLIKFLFFTFFLFNIGLNAQILEPPFWFADMKKPQLMLLIKAEGIGESQNWKCSNAKVKIDSIQYFPNKNYLSVWLDLSQVKQGQFFFSYSDRGKNRTIKYELKPIPAYQQPGFTEKDVMYLIMPDRFANGDVDNDKVKQMKELRHYPQHNFARRGGDLKGVENQLPYLKSLGISSLWLNPIYTNNQPLESYHGYAITNHYQVDPRLGDLMAYQNLINSLHSFRMKIIKDMVFNHVGDQHHLYKDLIDSNWFHFHNQFTRSNFRATTLMDPYALDADRKEFSKGWFDHHMPDLNVDKTEVAQYLIQQSLWWTLYFQLDAIRIDTYAYPGLNFMNKWMQEVKLQCPQLFIFGEIWEHGNGVQAFFTNKINQSSQLSSVTDFQLYFAIKKALNEKSSWESGNAAIYYTLAQDYMYADPSRLVTFIDNHDLARIFGEFQADTTKMISAIRLLMMIRGIPCILYGTEQGMKQTANHDVIREPMKGGFEAKKNLEEYTNPVFSQEIKRWTKWRAVSPLFDTTALKYQFVPQNGIYSFARLNKNEGMILLHNGNVTEIEVDLSQYLHHFNLSNDVVIKNEKDMEIQKELPLILKANEARVIYW